MKKIGYILFLLSSLIFIANFYFQNLIIDSIAKPIPLLILVLMVSPKNRYNKLIIGGFVFSLIGDVLLMRAVDIFVLGLIAFLTGHIFYIAAFLNKNKNFKLLTCIPFYVYAIAMYSFLYKGLDKMAVPVAFYIVIITTMLWRSFEQRNTDSQGKWAFWGALLFVMSDSMIAVTKFYHDFYLSPVLIMLTYWGGQFLIYWSTKNQSPASTSL